MTSRRLTVLPSARRLMSSLRDIGYSLSVAVADLVDNSIDAGATRVEVTASFSGEDSWLRVADNGSGMTPGRLDEAMRYGSNADYDEDRLGRYGLGLKTASLSQCRRVSVATRRSPARRRIHVRQWDLDHVEWSDAWEVLDPGPGRVDERLATPLSAGPGTAVLWEDLDRVLAYQRPGGRPAERAFGALERELAEHLAMVFHRLLAGEGRRVVPFTIVVNGEELVGWDPFARDESATRELGPRGIAVAGLAGEVVVSPYILPRESDFSSRAAHERAGGPRRWNRQQGLYVYRRDRLIQAGGWSRLRAEDEHTKLARIAVDIPPAGEELFGLDVSKSRVVIPDAVRPELKVIASSVAGLAQEVYRGVDDHASWVPAPDDEWGPAANVGDVVPTGRVVDVLLNELAEQPELLLRVLGQLGLDRGLVGSVAVLLGLGPVPVSTNGSGPPVPPSTVDG